MSGVTTIIEFTDPAQHTFDSNTVELSGGSTRLKSQVDSSEIFFANYDTDAFDVSKRGDKTVVFGGVNDTGQVVNGVLEFNLDRSIATYANITEIVADWAKYFKLISNITTIVSDSNIFRINSNTTSASVRVYFQNQGGGITRLKREITNDAGGVDFDDIIDTKTLSIGTEWEVAISNDDDGNIKVYVDGVLISTVASPGAFTFTDCDIIFGEDDPGKTAVADIDNAQLFSSDFFTSAPAFPRPEPTTYVKTAEQIETPIAIAMDSWDEFSDIISVLNGSEVRHLIERNSIKYRINTVSSVWEVVDLGGDLFAQSNTSTEIDDNVATFPFTTGIGVGIGLLSFLKSSTDGYTTPLLDQISLKYSAFFKGADVGVCAVVGKVVDMSGNPISGATVDADTQADYLNEDCLVSRKGSTTTNSEGIWSLTLIETETVNLSVKFTFTYTEDGKNKTFKVRDKIIPDNQVTCDFADLADFVET